MAYLDRKMEVKFSIEEKVKGTHGVQDLYPYEWSYPVGAIPSVRVAFNYLHTWQYKPLSNRA